jgi:Right handed beta helix region
MSRVLIRFSAAALLLSPACSPARGSAQAGGSLQIQDPRIFVAEGPRGGPFEPGARSLTLENPGSSAVQWESKLDVPWIVLAPESGSLGAGETAEIALRVDEKAAAALPPKSYAGMLLVRPKGQSAAGARLDCLLDVRSPDWTDLEPGPNGRSIYVSSSAGHDRNDGRSAQSPKSTIKAAKALLRSGFPDRLLLKRGDKWREPLGQWIASGRSAAEPMVIGSYGEGGERPLLLTGSSNGIETFDGGGSPDHIDWVALVGIHMRADGYTGTGQPAGVAWLIGSKGFLVEDCLIEGFHTNVLVQGYYGRHSGFRLRRSVLVDSYTTSKEPASHGLYLSNSDDVLIEENLFDHNGWNEHVEGATPSLYRHNIYVQSGSGACTGVVARRNILADASSHGLQLRPGGVAFENLFLRNSIALMLGGGNEPDEGGVVVSAVRNVILDGKDIDDSNPRGWGIEVFNVRSGTVSENVIAHNTRGGRPVPLDLHGDAKGIGVFRTTVADNVIWDWGGSVLLQGDRSQLGEVVLRGNDVSNSATKEPLLWMVTRRDGNGLELRENRFHSASAPSGSWFQVGEGTESFGQWEKRVGAMDFKPWTPAYPEPQRTIATYDASVWGAGTHESFVKSARGQSRANWREEYTARAAIEYFRQGFGMK